MTATTTLSRFPFRLIARDKLTKPTTLIRPPTRGAGGRSHPFPCRLALRVEDESSEVHRGRGWKELGRQDVGEFWP